MQSRRPAGDSLVGRSSQPLTGFVDAGNLTFIDASFAAPSRQDLTGNSKPLIRSLTIGDGVNTWTVVSDGQQNPSELADSSYAMPTSWNQSKALACWGVIIAIFIVVAIFAIAGSLFTILGGGANETYFSRFAAFEVTLFDKVMQSTYNQQALAQAQLFELNRHQMLCLAALQCNRFNDAYFAHFGVSINCNYEEVIFDTVCPVPDGAFTPFTFVGPQHSLTGHAVDQVFNHRSSTSADFAQLVHSLDIRQSPESYVHHRPGNSEDYQYADN